jgi:hypothetical protein
MKQDCIVTKDTPGTLTKLYTYKAARGRRL